MSLIQFTNIPKISKNASLEELLQEFSKLNIKDTFEFIITNGTLGIRSLKNEDSKYDITFPTSMLCKNTFFPVFCLCTGHINPNIKKQFLNHWQLMYLVLDGRLKDLAQFETIYGGLIQSDISVVNNFVLYSEGNAHNAIVKNRSTVVLLNPYIKTENGFDYISQRPLGEWLFTSPVNSAVVKAQTKIMNVVPGSESMLAEANKIVAYRPTYEFKAPGFKVMQKDGEVTGFYSIFPPKQNVPARLKTHLHSEAYNCINHDTALFLQDLAEDEDGNLVTKDKTFRNLVVLISEIEEDSYRFGAGEIEVSPRFAKEVVYKDKHRELQLDEIFIEEGMRYKAKNGRILIGKFEDGPRTIELVDEIEVIKIEPTGFTNSYRIEYVSFNRACNSRIVSLTGLKGVTKVMNNIGHADDNKGQLIQVDAVCSINSLKGKMNTIRLAQAALAFKYGYYTPKNGEYLNSLDEKEINDAVASLPEFDYVSPDGTIKQAKIGLIQACITELGSMYARIKPQSLSFNCMKYLAQNTESNLADHIQENYIDEHDKARVMELQKILEDSFGALIAEENLPIYTLNNLKNVFSHSDLILSKREILPSTSQLLNPELNQGFYIHCMPLRDVYIRIPSAEFLNKLWSVLPNGEYIYPTIILNISKIIRAALDNNPHYVIQRSTEVRERTTARDAYLKDCRSILFSEESYGQRMIQSLLIPKLRGFALKQIFDKYVPANTVVVLNEGLYNSLLGYVYRDSEEEDVLNKTMHGFTLRNPFLWRTQTVISQIWNKKHFAKHLMEVHNIDIDRYINVSLNKHCALIGKDIIASSHSDCDGDLISISTIAGEDGQQMLRDFRLTGVTKEQLEWDNDFLKSEMSSNEDFKWNTQYKLYYIPNHQIGKSHDNYMTYLTNAAEAKNNVGAATNDVWALYMVGQVYLGLKKNNPEKALMPWVGGKLLNMEEKDLYIFDHIYTKLVEAKVINAIKHVQNGSLGFQKYYLGSFEKAGHDKREILREILEENPSISKVQVMELIQLIIWACESGYLKACKSFISMHNKGVIQKDEEVLEKFPDVIKYTFFGDRMKEFYSIREGVQNSGTLLNQTVSQVEEELSLFSMF